jgi:hypothetical protein
MRQWLSTLQLLVCAVAAWVFIVSGAGAQAICGPALATCDLLNDSACLERNYACGEYDTIINTLLAERSERTSDQKYFVGASFYGKHIRERAAGVQCEMVQAARDYLNDYLGGVDKAFRATKTFGTVRDMDQIYHANQMFSELGEIAGCPESAYTRARIEAVAKAEADRYARDVFLNPPPAALDAFQTMQGALRNFVSGASDLETGIALRQIELLSAKAHLNSVRGVFGDIFGPVSGEGSTVAVDTQVLDSLKVRTDTLLRKVEIAEGEFRAALNNVTPEQYAALRAETIASARSFLQNSAFHINMIGVLLPGDPARPFWLLRADIDADSAGKQAYQDLDKIRSDWKGYGAATGICAQPGAAQRVWYCR